MNEMAVVNYVAAAADLLSQGPTLSFYAVLDYYSAETHPATGRSL